MGLEASLVVSAMRVAYGDHDQGLARILYVLAALTERKLLTREPRLWTTRLTQYVSPPIGSRRYLPVFRSARPIYHIVDIINISSNLRPMASVQ